MVEGQIRSLPECVHHWVIDPPVDPLSTGVCKNCNASRTFKNRDTDNRMWTEYSSILYRRTALPDRGKKNVE